MAPRERRFLQCDVFSPTPVLGNALAVVVDGDGLSTGEMQRFAAWTNLAETTFLLVPEDPAADYRVRIFTPHHEMPFAGHPTLGSCAAWLHSGGEPRDALLVRQECAVGIVDIDLSGERPAFVAPPTRIDTLPVEKGRELAAAMGIDSGRIVRTALLDNGPQWQVFQMADAADVLAVDAARLDWSDELSVGLIGPHAPGQALDFEVRMLASAGGVHEDPITGSLNAALAHWLLALGELDSPVVVAQGRCIGREGRVYIMPDAAVPGRVRIGGASHILIQGTVLL